VEATDSLFKDFLFISSDDSQKQEVAEEESTSQDSDSGPDEHLVQQIMGNLKHIYMVFVQRF
jgi:hypothetical protein